MQNKNIVGSICTFVINEIVNNKNIHLKYFICYIIIFVIILLYLLYIYILLEKVNIKIIYNSFNEISLWKK